MEVSKVLVRSVPAVLALVLASLMMAPQRADGQAPAIPCSPSMLSSFTPCLNFLSNSTANGTSPTAGCCSALKGMMNNGTDCLCQIALGGIPLRIPINRTVVMSLPKACNGGVPLQCKTAAAPVPAPGPAAFGPAHSPSNAAAPSPLATTIPSSGSPAQAPIPDTVPSVIPPSTSTGTGGSSSVNPTASGAFHSYSPSLLLISFAAMIIKFNC